MLRKQIIKKIGNDFLTFDFVRYYLRTNEMHLNLSIKMGHHRAFRVFDQTFFYGLDFLEKFNKNKGVDYDEDHKQRFTFKEVATLFDTTIERLQIELTFNKLKGVDDRKGGIIFYKDILDFVFKRQIQDVQKVEVIKELTEQEKFMQQHLTEAAEAKKQRAAEQEKKRIESHRKHKINFIPRKRQQDLAQ